MILVTGATGFIGKRIVTRLVERGEEVRRLVRPVPNPRASGLPAVHFVTGDVSDPDSLRAACDGVDMVVHTVAIIREKGRATFDAINVQGTRNVVEAAVQAGVRKIVHLSAIGAGPDLHYPYLRSKWEGEEAVVNSKLRHVVLRPSLVFGPGDEFINALAATIRVGPVVPFIGSGNAKFQPIHVEDVARCVDRVLIDSTYNGETIEIGGPDILTYRQITDMIIRTFGRRRIKARVPTSMMRAALPFLKIASPHPPITRVQLDMLNIDNVSAHRSVEANFDFQARPLEGNIDYILDMGWKEALSISLGLRPARRWPTEA